MKEGNEGGDPDRDERKEISNQTGSEEQRASCGLFTC